MAGADETGSTPGQKPRLSVPLIDLALYGLAALLVFRGVQAFIQAPLHPVALGLALFCAAIMAFPPIGPLLRRELSYGEAVAARVGGALTPLMAVGIWIALGSPASEGPPQHVQLPPLAAFKASLQKSADACDSASDQALKSLDEIKAREPSAEGTFTAAVTAQSTCDRAASTMRQTTAPSLAGVANEFVAQAAESCWTAYNAKATALQELSGMMHKDFGSADLSHYRERTSSVTTAVNYCRAQLAGLSENQTSAVVTRPDLKKLLDEEASKDEQTLFAERVDDEYLPRLAALDVTEPASISDVWLLWNSFQTYVDGVRDGGNLVLNAAQQKKLARLREAVSAKQAILLPRLRAGYRKSLKSNLWPENIEVSGSGRRIVFVGAIFASNANIGAAENANEQDLKRLRFDRADYLWVRGADGWSYTLKTPPDRQIVLFAN